MNSFLKALEQPEYVHVLLNHLPITGLLVALLGLVVALIFNQRAALLLALSLVTLTAVSVWPVAEYGERGYDRVLAMADDDGQAYLKEHARLADRWMFLYYATAAAGVVALVTGWKRPRYLRAAGILVALLAAGSLVAGGVIADYGGKVRHREFRTGPPPANAGQSRGVGEPTGPGGINGAGTGGWLA
jgi:hypothetical protein